MNRKTRTALIIILVAGAATEGAFLVYAWEAANHPCGPGSEGHEGLDVMSSRINSPTNITLEIYNSGTLETKLVSYTVKDISGDSYSAAFNPQPIFCGFGKEYPVDIVLAGPADGQPFTFQSGNNYTIGIMTKASSFALPVT